MSKVLTVRFSFLLEPDEFGLYSAPPGVKEWLREVRDGPVSNDLCTITVEPIADDASPNAPAPAPKRTRGPNKPKVQAPNGEITPRGSAHTSSALEHG